MGFGVGEVVEFLGRFEEVDVGGEVGFFVGFFYVMLWRMFLWVGVCCGCGYGGVESGVGCE